MSTDTRQALADLIEAAMTLERECGAAAGFDEGNSHWKSLKSAESRVLAALSAQPAPAQPVAQRSDAEITRLRAEAEALRKDAERYRWLRARPLDDDEIYIAVDSAKYPNRWGLGGDDPNGCDAAIDATKGTT